MNKVLIAVFLLISVLGINKAFAAVGQAGIDTTYIIRESDDDEADSFQLRRKLWFEQIHRAAPGTEWRAIEINNMLNNSRQRNLMRNGGSPLNPVQLSGIVCGNWSEKGSDNQAGRIVAVDYDSSANMLYVISDGGGLFSGRPDSAGWTLLNNQLQFTSNILKVTKNSGGGKRIVAAIGLNMYYSDDNGATFNPSTGVSFPVTWGGNQFNQLVGLNDTANTLLLITRTWDPTPWAARYWIYSSVDHGLTWNKIYTSLYGNDNNLCMWVPPGKQNFAYALLTDDAANVSTLFSVTKTAATILNTSTSLPVNQSSQFSANVTGQATVFYALIHGDSLYKSNNLGASWTLRSVTPGSGSQLGVTLGDSNKVVMGGVNAYRSYDGGVTWTLINDWSAYNGSPSNKLHADMHNFQFYKRKTGTEFGIINCDGGTFRSDDALTTVVNIGLKGLRTSELYDVICDKHSKLYCGSQDQGLQRSDSNALSPGVLNFTQIISGDFGKLQLTNNYTTLWGEYPGGNMYYWYNATGGYTANYSLAGSTKPLYGWMQATAPVYPARNNQIYLGGGNVTGGAGSYLVKLTGTSTSITASQINYDFRGTTSSGISAIGTTPLDTNRIYVAREDGTFYYSTNAGSTWNTTAGFSGLVPKYLFGDCIYASRKTANLVWFAGSGYSNPAVYKSADGGVTFRAMATGLPSTLVYAIAANNDESLLFAATDAGPYVYSTTDTTWHALAGGTAPAQNYWAVSFDSAANVVHFGTFGRGVWDFAITNTTPSVSLSADLNPVCTGAKVTFSATATNGGATPSYQWKKNGAVVGSNAATYTDSTLNSNDSIWVVITSSDVCARPAVATSNKIRMVVNPVPTVTAPANAVICSGSGPGIGLTASLPSSFTWTIGTITGAITGASAGSGNLINQTLTDTGSVAGTVVYNVKAISTTGSCPSANYPVTVTVNPSHIPSVSITANPANGVCSGASVVFNPAGVNGGTSPVYQWLVNGSNRLTGPSLSYLPLNGDVVNCIMTSNATCLTTATATSNNLTMTVFAIPATPVAGSNSPVNIGGSIQLSATTVAGATYLWSGPNGYSSVQQNPVIPNVNTSMSGTYQVVATANGCNSAAATVTVTVNVITTSTLAGTIYSETGTHINTVKVSAIGSPTYNFTTDTSGTYNFTVNTGAAYTLIPSKNNDTLVTNGITTLDYLLIQRHILGTTALSSPYKIIAADVNNSGALSSLDLLYIRSVILGNTTSFPGGRLWTFVPANYLFTNPLNPFPFPDSLRYASASTLIGQDFIGIKLGDVNNSWNPLISGPVHSADVVNLNVPKMAGSPQTEISVPVRADNFKNVSGFQCTIEWDAVKLDFVATDNAQTTLSGLEHGDTKTPDGKLAITWTDPNYASSTVPDGTVLFNIIYRIRGNAGEVSPVKITSSMIGVEIINNEMNIIDYTTTDGEVKIESASGLGALSSPEPVISVIPNPFSGTANLHFDLPVSSKVAIDVYDELGQQMEHNELLYTAGSHKQELGNAWSEGVYFIRFTAGDFVKTLRVVNLAR